jgi:hypothetical protein
MPETLNHLVQTYLAKLLATKVALSEGFTDILSVRGAPSERPRYSQPTTRPRLKSAEAAGQTRTRLPRLPTRGADVAA